MDYFIVGAVSIVVVINLLVLTIEIISFIKDKEDE